MWHLLQSLEVKNKINSFITTPHQKALYCDNEKRISESYEPIYKQDNAKWTYHD